jgi:biotin carboxyl carrier protein
MVQIWCDYNLNEVFMSKEKEFQKSGIPIEAPTPGKILSIATTGTAILGGTILYNIDCMKMTLNVPTILAGTFIAAKAVNSIVNAGDIIGYLLFPGPDDDYPLAGINSDIYGLDQ